MSDLDLLRGLADQLQPPPLDALRATARQRSRQAATLGSMAATAVVAVAATVVFAVTGREDAAPPPSHIPTGPVTRPLVYADGNTVHYGDKTVTADGPLVELDVTDDGVAFRTADSRVFFTDGDEVDEIGAVGEFAAPYDEDLRPIGYGPGWIVSGNTGSRLAWLEFGGAGAPEVVVFDTDSRDEVGRVQPTIRAGHWFALQSVDDKDPVVHWIDDPELFEIDEYDDRVTPDVRLDLATGTQTPVNDAIWQGELASRSPARTIHVNHQEDFERPAELIGYEITDGIGQQYNVRGRRLEYQGAQPLYIEDGRTHTKFDFAAPPGYRTGDPLWTTQWLDDDTVVLEGGGTADTTDLLTCRISTRACEVTVSLPATAVVPDLG
jgi:hypothetical protein